MGNAGTILATIHAVIEARDIHIRQRPGGHFEVWADGTRVNVHSRSIDAERTIRGLLGVTDSDAGTLGRILSIIGRPDL